MYKLVKTKKVMHSPTLNTLIMVEDTIKNNNSSLLSIAEIKRILPRKVNHITLMQILHYLERSNKIAVSLKGISWVHNVNTNLKDALKRGLEI